MVGRVTSKLQPPERDFSLKDAFQVLQADLQRQGFYATYDVVGREICLSYCSLVNAAGELVAFGSGKGEHDAAVAGSLFEAAEHLFSDYRDLTTKQVRYVSNRDVCAQNVFLKSFALDLFSTGTEHSVAVLPFRSQSESINASSEVELLYPLGLLCPDYINYLESDAKPSSADDFDYRRVKHYSTNSGFAIGMNRNEALIHGFLECIERQSLSKMLVDLFIRRDPTRIYRLTEETLPSHIRSLLDIAEAEVEADITILKMENKFGIPAFCNWARPKGFACGSGGYGCSLYASHALERSIKELVQYIFLDKYIYGAEKKQALERNNLFFLSGSPIHRECFYFDLSNLLDEVGYAATDFTETYVSDRRVDLGHYLSMISARIRGFGEIPFSCAICELPSGVQVHGTILSGEDHFFNVLAGSKVFPNDAEGEFRKVIE